MPKPKQRKRESAKRNDGRIVGILGTVIVHLIAAIIFMSFKLYSLNSKKEKETKKFEIEFTAVEEEKARQQPEQKKIPLTVENVLRDDRDMLNIARNLASKSEEKIDPKEYIDKVKEELIKSGKLGKDNFIDEQNQSASQPTEEEELKIKDQMDKSKDEKDTKPDESKRMAANYKGPTRIYYDLAGRYHTYLPIPIYKCEGSGKIVLLIEVDQRGYVVNASIVQGESTTNDECLVETALRTALESRFNPSENSPKTEKGTLTYIFVAQ